MIKNENVFFNKWLKENNLADYDFSAKPYPNASNREFWDAKYDGEIVSRGEKYLGYEWPLIRASQYIEYIETGDRLAQEKPSFARREALISLVLAETLEYRGRFLKDIVDGIFAICEETFWGVSAHISVYGSKLIPDATEDYIDLFAAETAELLSVTHYLLKDALEEFCPPILRRIEFEIDKRIINNYLERTDMWWMGYTAAWVNNWSAWILSNVLTAVIFMPIEREKQLRAIEKLMIEANFYYDIMPADGGCDEGPDYWMVSNGKFFEFCDLLHDATKGKLNFLKDEKAAKICSTYQSFYIGKGFKTTFGDCTAKLGTNFTTVYRIGEKLNDKNLCDFAVQMKKDLREGKIKLARAMNTKQIVLEIIYKDTIPDECDFTPCDHCVLEVVQTANLRKDKWFYSARGYNNYHPHSHNDMGSFMVFYDNEPVLIDAGAGVYRKETFNDQRYSLWMMRSDWHNLPTLNGVCETSTSGNCDLFKVEDTKTVIGFKEAYEKEAEIKSLVRSVDFDDGIVVKDEIDFNKNENTVLENFLTCLDVKVKKDRVILGKKYELKTNLPCKITTDFVEIKDDVKLYGSWNKERLYKVCFDFEAKEEFKAEFTLRRI